jgi:nitrate reductase / nitrite oxidoreductase, alpha subunit
VEGRLAARCQGPPGAALRRPGQAAVEDLRQPRPADARRLLRAGDVRQGHPRVRADRADRHPGQAATVRPHRRTDQPRLGRQLGGRPRRCPRARRHRPEHHRDGARRGGTGEVRVREDLHVPPAAHLRTLPQPRLRLRVPVGRDVQARGGRHRPGRSGPLPRLAHVRDRLPVQEGLRQPRHRQGGEVHLLLPAHRSRTAHHLLGDVRRPVALPRPGLLRRGRRARAASVQDEQELLAAQRKVSWTRTTPKPSASRPRPGCRRSGCSPRSRRRCGG